MLIVFSFVLLYFSSGVVESKVPACEDPNAVYDSCATQCPATCSEPYGTDACTSACAEDNCVCKDGYILNQAGGTCVKRENCSNGCNGDPNATKVSCASPCPPTCANPNHSPCIQSCAEVSCACKSGYILTQTRMGMRCVKKSECPASE